MRNLVEVSKSEQIEFINSFDHILCDLDGVIWTSYKTLSGSPEAVNKLKHIGKRIHYVSNNSTVPLEIVREKLDACGLTTNDEDIALPLLAIIAYLKEINFNRELYVVGFGTIKDALKRAGFLVAPDAPQHITESLASLLSHINDNRDIGGVLIDYDINVNLIKLQKAVTFLKRKDCIFLTGAGDSKLSVTNNVLIGPSYFMDAVINISGRQPRQIAKPSVHYNDYIVDRFKIGNPKRVLFIGDSINDDMAFATNCGYQKLLVLTGITEKTELDKWEHPIDIKPKYYLESLNELNEIVNSCFPLNV